MTKADDILFAHRSGLQHRAYEYAYDNAVSVLEGEHDDILRFDDGSQVKTYVTTSHEIIILPC